MMNLKTGYPFPLIKSGLPFEYPKLEKNIRTHTVVLGGGISGALVAHYLIKAGIECIVVDARSVGLGSTAASTSLLQYEIDTPLSKLAEMTGYKNAVHAYQLCARAIKKLKAIAALIGLKEFRQKGSLRYALNKNDTLLLTKEYKIQKQAGFGVEWLDTKTLQKDFGIVAPGALLSALAADTNAYLFTHYLHQYNIKRGLKLFDRSPVVSFDHRNNEVELKTQNGSKILAKKLVYATGYEAVEIIKKPIVKLKTTFATISEPFSDPPPYWRDDTLIWNTGDPYLYLRSTPDHRIMVGGRDINSIQTRKVARLIPEKTNELKKDFHRLFPKLVFIPEFSWAGIFGSTKDGLPYIGTYESYSNSYFALGYGGNGITFSQVAAEIIAQLIKGNRDRSSHLFSFDRS